MEFETDFFQFFILQQENVFTEYKCFTGEAHICKRAIIVSSLRNGLKTKQKTNYPFFVETLTVRYAHKTKPNV